MAYITFDDVVRTYGTGEAEVRALDGASFDVRRGELAVIVGASGAGKTTALNILGGMDTATSGRVVVAGHDITHASEAELVEYRRSDVGFVFQFYNLVPTGALDYQTGKQILQLLQDMCRRDGITVVLVTHNAAIAPMADRLIRFKSGRVIETSMNASPTPVADIEW